MTAPTAAVPTAPQPPTAWVVWLGYAGLVPFVLGAALVWRVPPELRPDVVDALATYAALIASFLGGIHWGLGMRQGAPAPTPFVWGVLPSLGAWAALWVAPQAGLLMLGLLLIVCYAVDRRAYPPLGLSAWLGLRLRLTTVASLSCFAAAAAG